MTSLRYILSVAVIVATSASQLSRAATDPYPEAHPPAGIQPKRPANYVPYQYPFTPQQLLEKYGPAMEEKAKAEWADLEKVNTVGPYTNTFESLAKHPCPEWFKDAKIGMFIDWGPWSVGGYAAPSRGAAYPDWYESSLGSPYHAQTWGTNITDDDLINLLSDRRFNPTDFARLAKECGFRYVVPFLKHHGGFCLWDSSFTRRDSMDWAFHKDFAVELSKACKKEGLKFGNYVSVGEWDCPAIRSDGQIGVFGFNGRLRGNVADARTPFLSGKIPVKDYVRDYMVPSIKELLDKTKPDLLWYDGEWENTSDYWLTRHLDAYYYNAAQRDRRDVCINDRWGDDVRKKKLPQIKVDYSTSEYGSGNLTNSDAWEECRSFSHNFGYNWTEESDPNAILGEPLTNAELACACGLSLRAFERRFHARYHCTPQHYIRHLRVRQSCHELVFSQKSLSEIAVESGFADQSHFNREFRRFLGETPGNYRKRHKH
jgi:alpha-L-fucosidase